jgi:Tfp pilus assembly protein PilV
MRAFMKKLINQSHSALTGGRCSSRKHLSGYTILETMFGATVMVLAITTSITTMQRAFLALDCARKITLAGQIMQGEFEKMRLEDWSVITGYPSSADVTASAKANFSTSSAIINTFTINRTVSDVHTDMKLITLTTTWKGYDGRVHSRSYSTYYGKNGLYDYFYNSY